MNWYRWQWCLACLMAGQCAMAADSVAPADPADRDLPPSRLEEVDQAIRTTRELPWQLLDMFANEAADESGRLPDHDVTEIALTEPVLSAIGTMREELAATYPAGATIPDAPALPLRRLLTSEVCSLGAIAAYWDRQHARNHHRNLIHGLIDRLPEAARASAIRELKVVEGTSTARADLTEAVRACREIPPAGRRELAELAYKRPEFDQKSDVMLDRYNALRQKLATDLAKSSDPADPMQRSIPCPEPAAAAASGDRRVGYRYKPDVSLYYPPEARELGITGMARIRVAFDVAGCVQQAWVAESTGAEELDAAAVRYAFDVALTPGVVAGKVFNEPVVIPIRFSFVGP